MEQLTCGVMDAAKAVGVSRGTVYNWLKAGKLESKKVGGRRLVKVDSVRRLVGADQAAA